MINMQMQIESSNSEEKKSFSERIKKAYQNQRILLKKEKRKVYYGQDLQQPISQTELGKRQIDELPVSNRYQIIHQNLRRWGPYSRGMIEDVGILIQDTYMYPYSVVGLVQVQSSASVRWTTGCVLDRNYIVTCIPGYQEGGINEQKIYFYPAYNSVSGGVKYRVRNLFRNKSTKKRRSEQNGDGDNNEGLMVFELDTDHNFEKNDGIYGLNFLQQIEIGKEFIWAPEMSSTTKRCQQNTDQVEVLRQEYALLIGRQWADIRMMMLLAFRAINRRDYFSNNLLGVTILTSEKYNECENTLQ